MGDPQMNVVPEKKLAFLASRTLWKALPGYPAISHGAPFETRSDRHT